MKLPPLPKPRKNTEGKITPKVIKWFVDNYPDSVAVEVKIKGNKAKKHQLIALLQVLAGVFYFKLPDMGRRNPFDFFILKDAKAFIVTCDGLDCEAVSPDGKEKFNFSLSTRIVPISV